MPVRGLTLNGSYSYIDAKYTDVTDASAGAILAGAWQDQVRQGVLALGWSASQADQAVAAVSESLDGGLDGGEVPPVPQLLRQAIRLLGRTR